MEFKFDQSVKLFEFLQSSYEPCVYKKCSGNLVVFLVLYVDDILLIENDEELYHQLKYDYQHNSI